MYVRIFLHVIVFRFQFWKHLFCSNVCVCFLLFTYYSVCFQICRTKQRWWLRRLLLFYQLKTTRPMLKKNFVYCTRLFPIKKIDWYEQKLKELFFFKFRPYLCHAKLLLDKYICSIMLLAIIICNLIYTRKYPMMSWDSYFIMSSTCLQA